MKVNMPSALVQSLFFLIKGGGREVRERGRLHVAVTPAPSLCPPCMLPALFEREYYFSLIRNLNSVQAVKGDEEVARSLLDLHRWKAGYILKSKESACQSKRVCLRP